MENAVKKKPCGCKEEGIHIPNDGMERILITGGSGFLGRKLFDALDGGNIHKGRFVRPMSRSWTGKDVTNRKDVEEEVAKVAGGFIFHLASKVSFDNRDKDEIFKTNVIGTQNILAAACKYKIQKVVVVSSACTIGDTASPNLVLNETHEGRHYDNEYVRSKHYQEMLAKRSGAIIVCPATCYLPLFSDWFIPAGGTNVIDAHDVVQGILNAMAYGRKGQKYILSNHNITYKELYRKAGIRKMVIPRWTSGIVQKIAGLIPDKMISPYTVRSSYRYKYYSNAKARSELKWDPKVSIDTMLKHQL